MPDRQGRNPFGALLAATLLLLSACELPAMPDEPPPASLPAVSTTPQPALPTVPAASLTPLPAPTQTPTAAPACVETRGRVESFSIPSQAMPKPLQFNLYLPPCFDPAATPGYPLLVLLHGQSSDAGQWLELGLTESTDQLIADARLPALLIALPYEEYSLRDPFATGFEVALTEELLPWLEQHYPLCGGRACRALGGISRGGAWALYLGITRPELFTAIGAHAAPPFYGSDLRLTRWLKNHQADNLPSLYLDVGRKDRYYRPIEEFHALLVEQGVAHTWQVNSGDHSDAYWREQLETYLEWYGQQLTPPDTAP